MYRLRQYVDALSDTFGLTRTLRDVECCRDDSGRMVYWVGNSAVVFKVLVGGEPKSLRCYFQPRSELGLIYKERLLPRELYIHSTPFEGEWVDVVLGDYIEGRTLYEAIEGGVANSDKELLVRLSAKFDALALTLLNAESAHGDLKPENIIVDDNEQLHLIDFDAMYLPELQRRHSVELGTAAYQHPTRGVETFDRYLDDYPIALISTAIRALSYDPTLYSRYGCSDGVLFSPNSIHNEPILGDVLRLFAERGDAVGYQIGRLLLSPIYILPTIQKLILTATKPVASCCEPPELFCEDGLWGYRSASQVVISPRFDSGFDFSEGLAAVAVGAVWHYIDSMAHVRLSLPDCEAIKPFRDSRAQIIRQGVRCEILYKDGEFVF